MIRMDIINFGRQHYILTADEPYRLESMTTAEGKAIVHVYTGVEIDMEQDPLACIDFTLPAPDSGHPQAHSQWWELRDGQFTSDKWPIQASTPEGIT